MYFIKWSFEVDSFVRAENRAQARYIYTVRNIGNIYPSRGMRCGTAQSTPILYNIYTIYHPRFFRSVSRQVLADGRVANCGHCYLYHRSHPLLTTQPSLYNHSIVLSFNTFGWRLAAHTNHHFNEQPSPYPYNIPIALHPTITKAPQTKTPTIFFGREASAEANSPQRAHTCCVYPTPAQIFSTCTIHPVSGNSNNVAGGKPFAFTFCLRRKQSVAKNENWRERRKKNIYQPVHTDTVHELDIQMPAHRCG